MATSAPDQDRLDELDSRVREAWSHYKDDLGELDGAAYLDAEPGSWEELQSTLRSIEADRAEVLGEEPAPPA